MGYVHFLNKFILPVTRTAAATCHRPRWAPALRLCGVLALAAGELAELGSAEVSGRALSPPVLPAPADPAAMAPVVITPPRSMNATAGQNVSFSVVAGGFAPLAYQWRKTGVNISGAVDATFTLTGIHESDAGLYDVVVSNSAGSVTSSGALLVLAHVEAPSHAMISFIVK